MSRISTSYVGMTEIYLSSYVIPQFILVISSKANTHVIQETLYDIQS